MLSVQAIWDDTVVFIKREQALLVPLALATLGLGNMGAALIADMQAAHLQDGIGLGLSVATLLLMLWVMIGQLGLIALALNGGCSVREALGMATRRLGAVIGFELLLGFGFALLALPAIAPLMGQVRTPQDLSHIHPNIYQALWLLALVGVLIWVLVRLMPVRAILVDQKVRIGAAIKQSYALTRGCFLPLFGVAVLYAVVLAVIQLASRFVLGSAFTILGKLLDSPLTGKVLEALVQSALVSVFGIVSAVFIAKLYRQLAA